MKGRKPKYTPERVTAICRAIADGETIQTACKRGGISDDTFMRWRANNPEFAQAIKKAEKEYNDWYNDGLVRDCKMSLKKLITGYEYDEVTTEYEKDKDGNPQIKKQKRITRMVAPNPTAIIFALTNRDPENWKNRQTTDITANVKAENTNKPDLSAIPDDLLEEVLNKINGAE